MPERPLIQSPYKNSLLSQHPIEVPDYSVTGALSKQTHLGGVYLEYVQQEK